MRALLLLLAGCHLGGGPIVAVSPDHGLRVGGEASAGLAYLGSSWGATFAPLHAGMSRAYLTFDPGYGTELRGSDPERAVLFGATIGKAYGEGDQGGLAAGVWAGPAIAYETCATADGMFPAYSAVLGFRMLAGVAEIYLTPKINGVLLFACD